VQKAVEHIANSKQYTHEYLPIDGHPAMYNAAAKLLFGDVYSTHKDKIVSVQCLSGTGSLRTGMDFIKKFVGSPKVLVSEPTWPNHRNIFNAAGLPHGTYRYYSRETNSLDIEGMIADIKGAPDKSAILLHACAHNPTGLDPTHEQWNRIADTIKEKGHFTFMDCAYQGFASGDLNKDAHPVRMFVQRGLELFVAQSFAKNFGLYGERVGAIHVVCSKPEVVEPVRSQLKQISRAAYSNPPCHGAYIVAHILNTPELYEEWTRELAAMAGRIQDMRQKLYEALKAKGIVWEHLIQQIGMFGYTGLNQAQVELLTKKHHVYLTLDGRISLAGLSTKTVPQLADAIEDVLKSSV